MERGRLGIENKPSTVFVFEGLLAHLLHPRAERVALRLHQWETALDAWVWDYDVCNYIELIVERFETPVEIITHKPIGFANALADRLSTMNVPVREVKSGPYTYFSPRYAVDAAITTVYDPDPAHRMGYGFKVREFSLGNR